MYGDKTLLCSGKASLMVTFEQKLRRMPCGYLGVEGTEQWEEE